MVNQDLIRIYPDEHGLKLSRLTAFGIKIRTIYARVEFYSVQCCGKKIPGKKQNLVCKIGYNNLIIAKTQLLGCHSEPVEIGFNAH